MIPEMPASEGSDTILQYSGLRRLALVPEGARVEVRGPRKSWIASHLIRYDQIKAVYRYEMRDWGYAVLLCVCWMAALIVVSIASTVMGDPGYFLLIAMAVVSVGLAAMGAFRIFTKPKRHLRIDIVGQPPMILANRNPAFFYQLASRLPKSEVVEAAPGVPSPMVGGAEAPAPSVPGEPEVSGAASVAPEEVEH